MRSTLTQLITLRQTADYTPERINQAEADRTLRRIREFVTAIGQGSGMSQ